MTIGRIWRAFGLQPHRVDDQILKFARSHQRPRIDDFGRNSLLRYFLRRITRTGGRPIRDDLAVLHHDLS